MNTQTVVQDLNQSLSFINLDQQILVGGWIGAIVLSLCVSSATSRQGQQHHS